MVRRERAKREDIVEEFDEFLRQQRERVHAKLDMAERRIKNYHISLGLSKRSDVPLEMEKK